MLLWQYCQAEKHNDMLYGASTISTIHDSVWDSIFDSIPSEKTVGKIIQTTFLDIKTVVTGSASQILIDGTPPLITEGLSLFTHSHTPLKTTSLLDILVFVNFSMALFPTTAVVTLFDTAVANTLAAATVTIERNTSLETVGMRVRYAHGTINPITFNVRAGASQVAVLTMNGVVGLSAFGNVPVLSGILVYEVEP